MRERIGGKRLERAGGAGASAWTGRLSAGALVLSAGWVLWSGLRPLPAAEPTASIAPGAIAEVSLDGTPVEARQAMLARVASRNLFAPDGRPWTDRFAATPPDEDAEDETGGQPGTDDDVRVVRTDGGRPRTGGGIVITDEKDVPDDVKKAREALRLRGIGAARDGALFAMVSIASEHDGKRSRVLREGDEFTDEKFKKAPWKVLAVDASEKSVVLGRSGVNVVLPLFESNGLMARASAPPTEGASAAPVRAIVRPAVEARSAEEIAADFKAAGFSDEEIATLLEAVRGKSPATASVAAPADTRPQAKPPDGFEDIMKMMSSGMAPPIQRGGSAGDPPPQEPAPSEEPAGAAEPK